MKQLVILFLPVAIVSAAGILGFIVTQTGWGVPLGAIMATTTLPAVVRKIKHINRSAYRQRPSH